MGVEVSRGLFDPEFHHVYAPKIAINPITPAKHKPVAAQVQRRVRLDNGEGNTVDPVGVCSNGAVRVSVSHSSTVSSVCPFPAGMGALPANNLSNALINADISG